MRQGRPNLFSLRLLYPMHHHRAVDKDPHGKTYPLRELSAQHILAPVQGSAAELDPSTSMPTSNDTAELEHSRSGSQRNVRAELGRHSRAPGGNEVAELEQPMT